MRRSRADAAISTTADLLSKLKDLSDAVPVPYVKMAFSAASAIFDMLDTMSGNKGECARLKKQIEDMIQMLLDLSPLTVCILSTSTKSHRIIDELQSTLLHVQKCLKKITGRNAFTKFALSKSIAKDLSDCREDIQDVIAKMQVYVTSKQYLEYGEHAAGVKRVGLSDIQRHRVSRSGEYEDVTVYDSRKAVMKVYSQQDMFVEDLKFYLDNKEAYLLQVFGYSEFSGKAQWMLLFHDPGAPAQAYIAETYHRESPRESTLKTLAMMTELLQSAQHVLKNGSGGCIFDTAQVRYHTSHGSIVLADWNPSRAYPKDSSSEVKTVVLWDSFVKLMTESLTGDPLQPTHVHGEYSKTGAYVSRAVKHFVHLLWNYRYQYKTADIDGLFRQLIEAVNQLRRSVEDSPDSGGVNPLLLALLQYQPLSASVCSMWDIYDDVDIEPGDVGYMYRDKESKKLAFQRITTLQTLVEEDPTMDKRVIAQVKRQQAPLLYFPDADPSPWDSVELSDGLTRYTLRLRDCTYTRKVGVKLGTDRASLNTRFDYPWSTVLLMAERLQQYADQYKIHVSDIMLIFNRGRAERYSHITFAESHQYINGLCQAAEKAGFHNDLLYYFDTPNVSHGQLEGYWSIDPEPGHPLWPPSLDESGTPWGWEHAEPGLGLNVEVSRKGTRMRMRYLHL